MAGGGRGCSATCFDEASASPVRVTVHLLLVEALCERAEAEQPEEHPSDDEQLGEKHLPLRLETGSKQRGGGDGHGRHRKIEQV